MGNANNKKEKESLEPIQDDSQETDDKPETGNLEIPIQEYHKTPHVMSLEDVEINEVISKRGSSCKVRASHKINQKKFIIYLYELEKDLEINDPELTEISDLLEKFSAIEHPNIQSIIDYHLIGEDKCFARYWRYIIMMESYSCSLKDLFDTIVVKNKKFISEREMYSSPHEHTKNLHSDNILKKKIKSIFDEESKHETSENTTDISSFAFSENELLFIMHSICQVLEYAYDENYFFVLNEENILLDFVEKKVLYCPITFDVNTESILANIYSDTLIEDEESNHEFSEDKDMSEFHFKKQLTNLCFFIIKLATKEDFELVKDIIKKKLDPINLKYPRVKSIVDIILNKSWLLQSKFKLLLTEIYGIIQDVDKEKVFDFKVNFPHKPGKNPIKDLKKKGKVYQSLKNYQAALTCFTNYLSKFKNMESLRYNDKANYAYARQKVGECKFALGDYKAATEEFQTALDYRLKNFPEKYLELAKLNLLLAISLYNSGNMKEALELCIDSLDYFQTHFGGKTPKFYRIGLKIHLFLLKVKENIFGKAHQSYLYSLSQVSECYRQIDEYEEALQYAKENVEILKKVVDKDDPQFSIALRTLGIVYYYLKDYKNGLSTLQTTLVKMKKIYGEISEPYAKTLNYIGKVYRQTEEYPEAMRIFQKVLEIRQELNAGDDDKVVRGYINIAKTLEYMDKWYQAIDWYLGAIELVKKRSKEPSFVKYRYVELLVKVAKINEDHAEYDEAGKFYEEALKFMQIKRIDNAKLWDEARAGLENLKGFKAKKI